MRKRKLITLFLTIFVVLGFSSSSSTVLAEVPQQDNNEPVVTIEEKKFGPYKDRTRYYENIDSITYAETKSEEDENGEGEGFLLNPISWVSNYVEGKTEDFTANLQDTVLAMFMSLIQLSFGMTVAFTEWMLTVLSFSNDAIIMNWLIDGVAGKVQTVAGISGGQVQMGTGTFGKLLGIFALISVLYVAYQAVFKRAPIESLKSIIQPIIAIALSILVISNFTTYLKGVNELGNEISDHIVTLTTEDEKGEYNSMEDRLWKIFVHRPYLYIQFGTDNEEKIGQERIENILLEKQTSEKKRSAIKKEVTEYGNEMMQPASVIKRLIYIWLFNGANAFLSIPIWLLSAALIGLQIWFIVVACFAPFVLVFSTLPNQFGVLKRYAETLLYPVVFKLIVSFIALILFTISDVVYSLPMTDGLTGYIIATFLQFIIFIVAFVFRKRIKQIFETGATGMQHVKESWDLGKKTVTKPIETGMQGAGAAVGGIVGGPQGVLMGASMGKTAGKTLTGEADLADLPMEVLKSQAHGKMAQGTGEAALDQLRDINEVAATNEPAVTNESASESIKEESMPQTSMRDAMDLHDIEDYQPSQPSTSQEQSVGSPSTAQSVKNESVSQEQNEFSASLPKDNRNEMYSNLVDINDLRPSDEFKTDEPTSSTMATENPDIRDINEFQPSSRSENTSSSSEQEINDSGSYEDMQPIQEVTRYEGDVQPIQEVTRYEEDTPSLDNINDLSSEGEKNE
ncbi:DUF4149 domain-containing protein [Bacillus sp. FJAT-47783]|uniref:DUF4149 domain-containing protein n=1 Tax=Bacillus sp. FJAT-47783 TaxID=2922712 RepID=UPI001FABB70F|nr:DUF4149 domain-containing protein [Bacillus sp. FJAT-47783]